MSVSPKKQIGDIIDLSLINARLFELLTFGTLGATARALFLFGTFLFFIVIAIPVVFAALVVQREYPVITNDIANNPLANEIVTIGINTAIELINAAFDIVDFFIDLWDVVLGFLYLTVETIEHALEDLLQVIFGTPKLQCVFADLISLGANIFGQVLIEIKIVAESTQRTLYFEGDVVPAKPAASASRQEKQAYGAHVMPELTEIDVSNNRQQCVIREANIEGLTAATINATTQQEFCSPAGGVNPDFDGGETEHELDGQCPANTKIKNDILAFVQVLIQSIGSALEFVIPTAIAFFTDVYHELLEVIPQFMTLFSKIINELKAKGVVANLLQVFRAGAKDLSALWNSLCFAFVFVGYIICTILGFLAQLLNSFVGTLICAFHGGTGTESALAVPALPPSIEASVFGSVPIASDAGSTQYGRAYLLTLNRPSDFNLSQAFGYYFVPPSNESFPQRERLNYDGTYNAPTTGTFSGQTAQTLYANQQAYLHSATRAAIICGLLDKTCQPTATLFSPTTPGYSSSDFIDMQDDSAAESSFFATNIFPNGCIVGDNVFGVYTNGSQCTDCNFDPCNIVDNTMNNYPGVNCDCQRFCNPNIMTNSGLPTQAELNAATDDDWSKSYSCSNPTGKCSRLPGQVCPTSNYSGQTPGTCSCTFCSGPGTGTNIPGPCYSPANFGDVIHDNKPYSAKTYTCPCEGSGGCGGSGEQAYAVLNDCGAPYATNNRYPNVNGVPTCKSPRNAIDAAQMDCMCTKNDYVGVMPCAYGGYFCMDWSLSQTPFIGPDPPIDIECFESESQGPIEFLINLYDCFEKDNKSPLFGTDDDDGNNLCGPPLNPSTPEDDSDLAQTTGLNLSVAGDTPANQFPNSSTAFVPASLLGKQAGYCPAGQGDDAYCNYPPNTASNAAFTCARNVSAAGGATNQMSPEKTGLGGFNSGTRCKAILQLCTCIQPLLPGTVGNDTVPDSTPIFTAVKCELQSLEDLVVALSNRAKSLFNLLVSLLRALPAIVDDIFEFIKSLALGLLTWLVEFAEQEGVIFITLANSATLSSGIEDAVNKLKQSDIWKQFTATQAGKTLTQLSTKKLLKNATCDAACLNGSKAGSECIATCPRTKCFLSGAPSLCCFPAPAPALFSGDVVSGVNISGAVDATSGVPVDGLLSDSHRFCIFGTTARDVDFSNVTMRFAKINYHNAPTGRFNRRMLQQLIGTYAQKSLSMFQNHSKAFESISKLHALADIMTGETHVYTPMRDDVEAMKIQRDNANRSYQYVFDPWGTRSQFGQIIGGLVGGAVQQRWAEYTKQREREQAADDAVNANVDLSDASTAPNTTLQCPTPKAALDDYCNRVGTVDPCCRCMPINGTCRASVKSPYCCCHKDSTPYECCKGLPGCLYPIFKRLKIPRILNVDFLKYVNADTCAQFNTAPKQILFLLRFFLGDFVHKFIAASDFDTMKNFYQFFLGWLEFSDDNSLPAFALLCFLLNIGRLLAFLLIVFIAGLLLIAFNPLINELFDTFLADIEEAQTIATQEDEAAGGGGNNALLQQQLMLGGGSGSVATPS